MDECFDAYSVNFNASFDLLEFIPFFPYVPSWWRCIFSAYVNLKIPQPEREHTHHVETRVAASKLEKLSENKAEGL